MSDAVVIGGGHNALTTAFYLAKAGLKVVVLERRPSVGGGAATDEIAPGVKCPTLAHAIGPLRPGIVRDMGLERRGVAFLHPDPRVVALSADGRPLRFAATIDRTAESIRAFSARDAERYPQFCAALSRLGAFLGALVDRTPPSLNPSRPAEYWDLLKTGRRFRSLGREDGFRLLRWMPMAVADLVGEWFETDLLQAAIAARGVFGTSFGPWSAGSGAVMLMQAAVDDVPGGSSVTVQGGPGALSAAMAAAACEAGAEILTDASVARVVTREGRATGVTLEDGRTMEAATVVSGVDPRRTCLTLLDPFDLEPTFLTKVRNYRCPGTVSKVNLVLNGVPSLSGLNDVDLRGRIHIGPSVDYLERAFDASKYGELPAEPYLDITIPSLLDASLAPAGRHVMSIVAHFTPYRLASKGWDEMRDALGALVVSTVARYAPGFENLVEQRQVLTPVDLERDYGYTGGHIFHGEPSLDQLLTMRPLLGWSQYRTPIDGLYWCGAGTHGGLGITAASGRSAAREILRDRKHRPAFATASGDTRR